MQYVRSLGGSVSKTWNSINPATLSGAIDVIVVEQEDGSLACSPFHVRFGKFSLLRPYEKKVEFKVNGDKKDYPMKLGEGGEAFFVFETSDDIPESLQTSPVISPASSPGSISSSVSVPPNNLQEPEFLDLNTHGLRERRSISALQSSGVVHGVSRTDSDIGAVAGEGPPVTFTDFSEDQILPALVQDEKHNLDYGGRPRDIHRASSDELFPSSRSNSAAENNAPNLQTQSVAPAILATSAPNERSISPPPLSPNEIMNRAKALSQKLSGSNIPSKVNDSGDLMLDMTGYKTSEEEALRAEVIARKILAEELEGNYDIGALIGADEHGNLWIYSSEEAKEAAARRIGLQGLVPTAVINDAASDPGYHSDEEKLSTGAPVDSRHQRAQSDSSPANRDSSVVADNFDSSKNYAKTLRLTSEQLKALELKPGANSMSFSVNRATCQAYMYYWKYNVPIVISDIDGTITKSDALGHVLNMIGRDWTHIGVAKLYTDITANGYNILYLTSRSVGQADTTRTYLNGVVQEGYKLPKGPVIMSPDRTIAALRREIYLRKPEVFKMACLRDILGLFNPTRNPFYAGFGNRLTDALSYRSVNIPSTRIFTINSNAEVSLHLLTLNTYKTSYVSMRDLIDQFFPPVGLLVVGGGEDFTDFNYWREAPLEIEDLSDSEFNSLSQKSDDKHSVRSEDEGSDGLNDDDVDDVDDDLAQSYLSQESEIEGGTLMDSVIESADTDLIITPSADEAITVLKGAEEDLMAPAIVTEE